ncbi:MAG: hypothetical protein MR427_05140 [Roseburia sp.]|nr:hypothetical protein [Roseburia sp.]
MAKYIVEDRKTSKFEKNYKFPMINLIPAIVWSIPIYQKISPLFGTLGAYGAVVVFIVLFMTLSYLPFITAVPGVAGVVMLTAMLWAPADHIGNNVVRFIVKGLILVFIIMVEFCIWINATLPWLERKESSTPIVRKVEE